MHSEPSSEGLRRVRLLLADQELCVAEGISALLSPQVGQMLVVHTGADLLKHADSRHFDVAVFEIDLPDMSGLTLLQELAKKPGSCPAIVLSGHDEPLTIRNVMQAGAWGYVLKRSPSSELVQALVEVTSGRRYISPTLMAVLVNAPMTVMRLTQRQRQVLMHMARGKRASEIATILGISVRTVESHRQALFDMFGLHSGVALLREAHRLGLIREGLDDPSVP